MANADSQKQSTAAKAVWLLLFLTAALHLYLGLSSVAYVFMGVSNPASGMGAWLVAAAGGLQTLAAIAAFVTAARRDLGGATLALAGSTMLGWVSTLPSTVEQGLDFGGNDRIAAIYFVLSPAIAIVAAALTRGNRFPLVAAFVVTAPTFAGILAVIAFAIIIAMYGF